MIQVPDPTKIRHFRTVMGLTQKEAAAWTHVSLRAWQWWESGQRAMPLATWELCVIKAGYHPRYKPITKER